MVKTLENLFIENHNVLDISFIILNKEGYTNLLDLIQPTDYIYFTDFSEYNKDFYDHFLHYKHTFTSLSFDNFRLLVLYILHNFIPELFKPFKNEIDEWTQRIKHKKKELKENFKEIKKLDFTTKMSYIDFHGDKFVYNLIDLKVIAYLNNDKSPFDIYKLLREYKLNKFVPLLYTKDPVTKQPIVKFDKNFKINGNIKLGQEQIKKWLLKNKTDVKIPNNLIIKLKTDNNTYTNVKISKENSALYTKIPFNNSNITLQNSKEIIYKNLDNLNLKLNNIEIIQTGISIEIKRPFLYYPLKQTIKEHFNNLFTVKEKKVKNILVLSFTADENVIITISGKKNEPISKIIINSIKQENELYLLIDILILIFYHSNIKNGNNKKEIKKIKKLRNIGLDVSSVGCQKIRQPTLFTKSKSKSKTKSKTKSKYSYILKDPKSDKEFVCENPDFFYPGYTNNNIVCCFKKDQRNKLIYKRNTIGTDTIYNLFDESDPIILKKPIIVTNKTLELNRLGVLPKNLKLPENFYRLGNIHDSNSVIHSIELIIQKYININKVIVDFLDEKVYRSLCNGDLFNNTDYNDFKVFLQNGTKKGLSVLELIAKYLNISIVLFENGNNTILFNSGSNMFGMIYKYTSSNNIIYEPIVKLHSNKIIRLFGYPEIKNVIGNSISDAQLLPKLSNLILNYDIEIKMQFVNAFNKVTYLQTNYGIIPIHPSGLIFNKDITFDFSKLKLLSPCTQLSFLKKLNYLNYQVIGQIIHGKSCIGLVTKSNIIIPTAKGSIIKDLPPVNIQFFPNIDNLLVGKGNGGKSLVKGYGVSIDYYKELQERVRYTLNIIIRKDISIKTIIKNSINKEKTIKNILKNYISLCTLEPKEIPFIRKVCSKELNSDDVNVSLDPFCKNDRLCIPKIYYNGIITKIVNDIISYNKKGKELLDGKIRSEILDKNAYIKRSNEKIILYNSDVKHI